MNLSLRIPPAVLVLVIAIFQWWAANALPRWPGDFPGRNWIALALFALGLAAAVLGILSFRRARTTVNPMNPSLTSTLVSTGIYRWSRNPMYLGFALWLLAWSVLLGSLVALLLVVAFVAWMNRFQISPEERALQRHFGAAFDHYCRRTRRWL